MGSANINSKDLDYLLDELRKEFKGEDYNILLRNCNHFAEAFIHRLLQKNIPSYVNRLAYVGSMFSCLMPPSLLDHNPVDNTSNSNYSNSRQITNTANQQVFYSKGTTLGGSSKGTTTEGDRKEVIRQATLRRLQMS